MLNLKLYPCFKHLLQFNNIWLYSDPHFNDSDCLKMRVNYLGDEEQVKSINSIVGKKDCLIILGDIGDVSYIKKLRGYKILVMGNHDSGASNYARETFFGIIDGVPVHNDNHLFDEIYEGPVCIAEKIILSHEPIQVPGMLNIHGHTHSKVSQPKDENHLCVCAENIDYKPISLLPIIKNGRLSKIESIHRQTIDTATKRKQRREQ